MSSEEAVAERSIFESYGIVDGSMSDKYRELIRFLAVNIQSKAELIPAVKFTKPPCENLAEIEPSKYRCVHEKPDAPPKRASIHLAECAECWKQKQKRLQQEALKSKLGGEIDFKTVQVKHSPTPNFIAHSNPELPTPNPSFTTVEVNYVTADGRRICPFRETKNAMIHYAIACPQCRKETPKQNEACIALCKKLREELNQKRSPLINQNGVNKT